MAVLAISFSTQFYGIAQSMSRKGNLMDYGLMKNFFGLIKMEIFMVKKISTIIRES